MPAATKTAASKAGASAKPAMSRVSATPCTAIVSYEVGCEDVDTFMDAWDQANAFLKKQPGHVGTQLYGAVSANPTFRFVAVAKWKSADDLRKAIQSSGYAEASGRLSAYPVHGSAYDVVRG
jgi:heme-degrading monooxygenase HmoA